MMIKPRGPATVMAIILLAAAGWAAVVTFILATNLLIGAAWSLAGGIAIGAAVVYLMWRWWFKGIQRGVTKNEN